MPRPRKREESDADSARGGAGGGGSIQSATKRQRVSLACDACRAAREKCDGGKPQCGPCSTQSRRCSYTPASKKRGVATGYLRTLELSLAWMFDRIPESETTLNAFLADQEGDAGRILLGKDAANTRLHRRWTKSRAHREVTRLLSEGPPARTGGSPDEGSETEVIDPGSSQYMDMTSPDQAFSISPQAGLQRMPQPTIARESPRYQLPKNWRHLLTIHFSHTQDWLPILDRGIVTQTAETYPPQGLVLDPSTEACADHAQLWAALALASFQDPSDPDFHPKRMFTVARNLIPSENGPFHQPHVSALLLHGLVLLGQGSPLAACLVIGTACRIALQLHAAGQLDIGQSPGHSRSRSQSHEHDPSHGAQALGARLLAACSVLDTWASLYLGQPTVLGTELNNVLSTTMASSPWLVNQYHEPMSSGDPGGDAEQVAALYQLNRFGNLLNEGLRAKASPGQQRITSEDLVKSLDSQFSYCNCLIHEDSTPMKPTAFLLQLAFLTATVALASQCRPSLLSTVFEVAETCLTNFGASGTPPLVVGLLRIVFARGAKVSETEQQRWEDIVERCQSTWNGSAEDLRGHIDQEQVLSQPLLRYQGPAESLPQAGPVSQYAGLSESQRLTHGRIPFEYAQPPGHMPRDGMVGMSNASALSPEAVSQRHISQLPTRMPLQSPALAKAPATTSSVLYGNSGTQGIDYDAIMEELGSIDCSDIVDADPQFMTNLGFAPDYDLGEMFQQGYFAG